MQSHEKCRKLVKMQYVIFTSTEYGSHLHQLLYALESAEQTVITSYTLMRTVLYGSHTVGRDHCLLLCSTFLQHPLKKPCKPITQSHAFICQYHCFQWMVLTASGSLTTAKELCSYCCCVVSRCRLLPVWWLHLLYCQHGATSVLSMSGIVKYV